MNKKLLTILFTLIIIPFLTVGCGTVEEENSESVSVEKIPVEEMVEETEPFNGSMQELYNQGKTMKCVIKVDKLEGHVYVTKDRLRTDFTIEGVGDQHMIVNDDGVYTWSSYQAVGLKMSKEQFNISGENDTEALEETGFFTDSLGYNCSTWEKDESIFVPSSEINFIDLGETPSL